MKFTKMHGLGNDYVYINGFAEKVDKPRDLAIKISDRHFGVGGDGLVLILPSKIADFRMRMFNADGSEAEMCGNAIRCVGKYVYDRDLTNKEKVTIETLAGIKVLDMTVDKERVTMVTVDMGEPTLDGDQIPVKKSGQPIQQVPLDVDGESYHFTCVSMGNPHAITYVEDTKTCPLERVGPLVEVMDFFPKKTNVEFVHPVNDKELDMRVWERGTGETLACGTGACATMVAGYLDGYIGREAIIHLLGGDLHVRWDQETNHIFMTGPASFVFDGVWIEKE